MKSPLSLVKEKFGDKEKLVAAVETFTSDDLWVSRTNKDKGLAHVSNAKLLRLYNTFSEVKEKFGTRAALIDAILEIQKRVKDAGYKSRLTAYPVPRLFDLWKSVSKKTTKKPAAPKGEKKPVAAKKAAAAPKKTAAKKASGKKPSKKG
jgi:hypothetical protein